MLIGILLSLILLFLIRMDVFVNENNKSRLFSLCWLAVVCRTVKSHALMDLFIGFLYFVKLHFI